MTQEVEINKNFNIQYENTIITLPVKKSESIEVIQEQLMNFTFF